MGWLQGPGSQPCSPPAAPQVLMPHQSWGTRPHRARPAWSPWYPRRAPRRVLTQRGARGRVWGVLGAGRGLSDWGGACRASRCHLLLLSPSHLHCALLLPLSIFCLLFPSSTFSFLISSSLFLLLRSSRLLLPPPLPLQVFIPSPPLLSHRPAPCSCLPVPCPPSPTLCAPSLGALSSSQLGGRLCPLPVLVPLLWGPCGGRRR